MGNTAASQGAPLRSMVGSRGIYLDNLGQANEFIYEKDIISLAYFTRLLDSNLKSTQKKF